MINSYDQEKKLRALEKLLEVNLYLNQTPNLETLLGRIISISKDIFHAYSTSIILLDEEKKELYFQKIYDSRDNKALQDEKALKKITLKMGEGIAGYVAESGRPLIINDVQSDPRFSPKADTQTGVTTKNMIAIPLKGKDRIIGVMEVINRIEGDFDETDLPMCLAIGNVASVAIENAQLYFEMERNLSRLAKMEASKYQLVNLLFHALKTPVSSIKGYAEYVIENLSTIDLKMIGDFAEITHKEVTNINKMIIDLYVINEYNDLAQRLFMERLNLGGILQVFIEKRAKLQKNYNYILKFEPEGTDFTQFNVEIDYEKIEHTLQHLLDIVTQYTPGGGTITLRLRHGENAGYEQGAVELEIEDEGLIIPDDIWEGVFETIQGQEPSGTNAFEGIGLGLFISRKIIEAHGGTISWLKKEEAGSRIFITLPCRA